MASPTHSVSYHTVIIHSDFYRGGFIKKIQKKPNVPMKVQMRQFYLPNDLLQSLKVLMIHVMNVVYRNHKPYSYIILWSMIFCPKSMWRRLSGECICMLSQWFIEFLSEMFDPPSISFGTFEQLQL